MDNKTLQNLIVSQMSSAINLRPLAGFKMDFSANPEFQKVFFAASCECGTSALLSLEVSIKKSDCEINNALPSLIEKLQNQEKSFRSMNCTMHGMMRKGFIEDKDE